MAAPGDDSAGEDAPDYDSLPDDLTIGNDEVLWRRVKPAFYRAEPDALPRIFSGAFANGTKPPSPMSADLASIAKDPTHTQKGDPASGVVEISVAALRQEEQKVVRDPEPDNDAHVLVIGAKSDNRRNRLRKQAKWVLLPKIDSPEEDGSGPE